MTASRRADRIREQFVARQAEIVPETVTISAGIAVFADRTPTGLHALVKHADLALYQSKNGGRARSTVYRGARQPER